MLKPEIIEKIKKDFKCRNAICFHAVVHPKSLERWLYQNHKNLENVRVLTVICDYFSIDQSDVLEPSKGVNFKK